MPKKGASLLWPMVVVTLLIVSTCTTIVYAYFNTDTLASTTIKFNGGVALTIQAKDYDTSGSAGLSISNGEYGQWLRKIDNETTWGDNTNATSSLTMSGLRVSPRDSSEPVYVRTMVVITVTYTSATAPSIPDIPFVQSSQITSTLSQDNCTTKEWAMISGLNTDNAISKIGIAITELPTTPNVFTDILDDYNIWIAGNTSSNDAWQGATISAMIMITASTENSMEAWNLASQDATYSFTL